MSSIDEHGRRAGADLRRSASRTAGPPLTELAARPDGRNRRVAAVGLAAALVVGATWSTTRADDDTQAVEVRDTGSDDRVEAPDGLRSVPDSRGPASGTGESASGEPGDAPPASSSNGPSAPGPAEGGPPPGGGGSSPATAAPRSSTPSPAADPSPTPAPSPGPTATPPPAPSEPETPPTTPATPPTTTPPPDGPPTAPLVPSSPAWARSCAATDRFLAAAWALDAGTSDDVVAVAVPFIEAIGAIPTGTADAEVAYAADLVDAIERGHRVAPFAADFLANTEVLLTAIGNGCGTPAGLPLPSSTVPTIYSLLFESGIF